MKTRCLSFLLVVGLLCTAGLGTAGCGADRVEETGGMKIYYVNKESTQIVPLDFAPSYPQSDTAELIAELLDVMTSDTGEIEYVRPIPEGVDLVSYEFREDILLLYFDEDYYTMDPVTEILCRLAMVSTFCQVDRVRGIEIYAAGEPLLDQRGSRVGVLKPDSFVENPGEQINSINRSNITLYFATGDGQKLVREDQTVYYNSNIALERVVVEHLIAGPATEGLLATIPSGTNLTSVTTVEGVCYLSLDTGFQNQNYEISEAIVIYSIVDSLTALPYVDRVQISVNGDTTGVYRDSFELSKIYENDLSYVSTQPLP